MVKWKQGQRTQLPLGSITCRPETRTWPKSAVNGRWPPLPDAAHGPVTICCSFLASFSVLLLLMVRSPCCSAASLPVILDGRLMPMDAGRLRGRLVQYSPYNGKDPSFQTLRRSCHSSVVLSDRCIRASDRVTGEQRTLDNTAATSCPSCWNLWRPPDGVQVRPSLRRREKRCRMLDDAGNRDYAWDGLVLKRRDGTNGDSSRDGDPYRTLQYDEQQDGMGFGFRSLDPERSETSTGAVIGDEASGSRSSRLMFDRHATTIKGHHLEVYPCAAKPK